MSGNNDNEVLHRHSLQGKRLLAKKGRGTLVGILERGGLVFH